MTETPGWTSPGSPEPPSGTAGTGHSAPAAPAALLDPSAAPAGPGTGPVPLRPLGFGELMDGTFALVRRNWRAAFGLTLALAVALQLLQAGIDWWIHVSGDQTSALLSDNYLWPLATLFGVLASGLLAPVVGNGLLGRDTSAGRAWAQVRPRFGRLLLLCLLLAGISIGAFAVAFVPLFVLAAVTDQPALLALLLLTLPPVVWLTVRLTLAAPALVLEHQPVLGAVKRSWRLSRGSWWRIFGLQLVFRFCLALVGAVLSVPGDIVSEVVDGLSGSAGDGAAAISITALAVFGIVAGTVTVPLGGALDALIYTDQRIRREALDLELARTAGLPGHGLPGHGMPAPAAATTPSGA
ncbi:glycerophosphoryl diester phosphodiesterase membrane domain-containing protein [Kitasatospora sp. NPDC057198]|uniref:glycerophosphoryl diester phosphodiesterase membrane domain-containing protein n=1 Tax=Kitasatospora sp. NPDC057198 TaxID=3346046 RepID=UPI003638B1BA